MCRWRSRRSRRSTKKVEALARRGRIRVLAPLVKARKGFHTESRNGRCGRASRSCSSMASSMRAERFQEARALPRAHHRCASSASAPAGTRAASCQARARDRQRARRKVLDAKNRAHVLSTEMSCPGAARPSRNSIRGSSPSTRRTAGARSATASARCGRRTSNPRLETALEIEMEQERQHEWLDEGEAEPCPSVRRRAAQSQSRAHVRVHGADASMRSRRCPCASALDLGARS